MNAKLLRGKIVSAGFTQQEVAAKLGICENTLSSRMNGHSSFNTHEIAVLCSLLNIEEAQEKIDIFLS